MWQGHSISLGLSFPICEMGTTVTPYLLCLLVSGIKLLSVVIIIFIFIIICSAGAQIKVAGCMSQEPGFWNLPGLDENSDFYKTRALGAGPGSCRVTDKGSLY